MKKFSFLIILLLLSSFCAKKDQAVKLAKGTPAYELAKEFASKIPFLDPDLNNIIATTNDFVISTGDIIQNIKDIYGNQTTQFKNMDSVRLKKYIEESTKDLVERRLLLNAAIKAGVNVTQAEVDSALNFRYSRGGGKEKFLSDLAKEGLSLERVSNDIREGLMNQKHLKNFLEQLTRVTEEEILTAYNEEKITIRHILLSTDGKTEAEKQEIYKKMLTILERARKNEDFAKLAQDYSEDHGSKTRGGLISNISKGDMLQPLDEAAFSITAGAISSIIESHRGYHILQVVDRMRESRPLEEVRSTLAAKIKRKNELKAINARQNYLEKLKEEAGLKIVDF